MSCVWLWNNDSSHWLAKDIWQVGDYCWYSLWNSSCVQKGAVKGEDTYTGDTNGTVGTSYYAYTAVNGSQFASGYKYSTVSFGWLQGLLNIEGLYSGTKDMIINNNFHFVWSHDDSYFVPGKSVAIEVYKRGASSSTTVAKHIDCSAFNDNDIEKNLTHFRNDSNSRPENTWKKCNKIYFYSYGDGDLTVSGSIDNVITSESGSTSTVSLTGFSTSSWSKYLPTYCRVNLTLKYAAGSSPKKKYLYFKTGSTYYFLGYLNPEESYYFSSFSPYYNYSMSPGETGAFILRDAELVNQYTSGTGYTPNIMFNAITDEFVIHNNNAVSTYTKGYYLNSSYLYPNDYSNVLDYTASDYNTGIGIGTYMNISDSSKTAWDYVKNNFYVRQPFKLFEQTYSSCYALIPATSNSNPNSYGTLFKDSSGNLVNIKSFNYNSGKNYITSSSGRMYNVYCPCFNLKNKCAFGIEIRASNWLVPINENGYAIPAKKDTTIEIKNTSSKTRKIYIDDELVATLNAEETYTKTVNKNPGNILVISEGKSTNKIRVNGEWKDAQAKVYVSGAWKDCTAYVWKDGAWHQTS